MHEGVIETRLNKEDLIYEDSCTLDEVKSFFKEASYKIIDKKFIGPKELNVFFKNEKFKNFNKISINKFNPRFIKRITEDRMNIKDSIYIFYLKRFKLTK